MRNYIVVFKDGTSEIVRDIDGIVFDGVYRFYSGNYLIKKYYSYELAWFNFEEEGNKFYGQ